MTKTIEVETVRLDDISDLTLPDYVKIDVQGAELLVMENALDTFSDVLVVETKNFHNRGWFATSGAGRRLKGIPTSRAMHLIERYERVSETTICGQSPLRTRMSTQVRGLFRCR